MSLEGFTKNLDRVNVPGVGRNEVPDIWTAGGERALPELGDEEQLQLSNFSSR